MASQDEYQQQQFFKQRGVWCTTSDKFPSCYFMVGVDYYDTKSDGQSMGATYSLSSDVRITNLEFKPSIKIKL